MLCFVQKDTVLFFTYDQESELFLKRKDFFYYPDVFKGAKLAKFIRFEAGWKLMWDEVRGASISITKCTEMG